MRALVQVMKLLNAVNKHESGPVRVTRCSWVDGVWTVTDYEV